MAALPVPAAGDPAVMLFFREKAFWQFGRGNRLGDLRRLIRQYEAHGRRLADGQVPQGGRCVVRYRYHLPVTDNEKQNPNFTGCIDRKA